MAAGCRIDELADAVGRAAAGKLSFSLHGDASRRVSGVAPLQAASGEQLSFLANPRYRGAVAASRAGAIVMTAADRRALFADGAAAAAALIECANPYAWFAFAAQLLSPGGPPAAGVADGAHVAADASVDGSARIDAGAVVESGAAVGPRCWVGAGAFVGAGARLGADCRLHPGARVLAGCVVGARGIVHSGAVIGSDGFGFAPLDGRWIKIPQTGRVVIGDDVEIGANVTIDRGTFRATRIGRGTKIDNLVHVAHNVRIGENVVIAAQTGIAGSAVVEDNVVLAGQAGIADHARIEAGVLVGAQAGVPTGKVLRGAGQVFWGTPARPIRGVLRELAALARLARR